MGKLPAMLCVAAALALAGCGYRPLYGSAQGNGGVAGSLSSISIPEAGDRAGQLVRNDLLSSMQSGKGEDRYLLNLTTVVADNNIVAKRQPAVTRQSIQITATYQLVEKSTGAVLTQGTTFARASYDVIRQPFADQQAQTDATERAALEVSADIRTRLAAHFAKQQTKS
ncbi:MAG: LPS assembly lipoprotein LptE [Aestuariivirga sp.]|uniref:LPS assembly lipoprotein LptE n=1 Tax=Aestuariivirga sp. TaxID=2650926 RepID=UPI0038D00BD6